MLPTAHPHTLPQDMPNQDILPEDMTDAELVGCPCCDGLTRVPALRPGEQALCSYCGQPLSHHRHHALDKVIAYAITALILLITANVLPFLTLQVTGIENVIDLPSTSISLLHKGMPLMAMVISSFILILPAILLLLVLALYIPLRLSLSVPWLITTGRLVFSLQNWCMVDVFLLALVVSLVKLATMATVILGLAFWAYVAFVWCFTLMLTCIDRLQCWRLIETLTPSDGGTGP
jgi:paraquat-inducible protein A